MSIRFTFLGHATVLIQDGPLVLLTDPLLGDRALLARRRHPLPIPVEEIPRPTAVLVSNARYDHLDLHTLKFFDSGVPIVLPPGAGRLVAKFVRNPLLEIERGTSHRLAEGLTVTAFPVANRGFRLTGLNYRGANGYWIEVNGRKIFYPGDTGYREDFAGFREPDAALLPIGPSRPGWLMRRRHLSPADAIRVMEETGAKKMIPVKWGAFTSGFEAPEAALDELKRIVEERRLQDRVAILEPGGMIEI
jgi:L-ascorbate metabolism protein UlaG (beta-lactamase superfamily)